MKYPKLNNWLIFRRKDKLTYEVRDCLNENEFTMGIKIARFARKLDGKHDPFQVDDTLTREEVSEMLNALEEHDLLRHNRVLMSSTGTVYRTLWFPGNCPLLRVVAILCNTGLKTLWLPVFVSGLYFFMKDFPLNNTDYVWIGTILGIIVGMLLHELGHANAGLAYGARVFEMGVMLQNFLPGAYVLLDTKNVKSKLKRIQISAAGVQANMLLAGCCFILACLFPDIGAACLCAAINNVIMAAMNITFVDGLDGTAMIAELLGMEDLISTAKAVTSSRRIRRSLVKQGATGYAIIAISVILQIFQITLPVIIVYNGLEVIGCFL